MKIAITGGIGSGKSYVCKMLTERGIGVYDCDAAAKRLMNESDDIKSRLSALVGDELYQDMEDEIAAELARNGKQQKQTAETFGESKQAGEQRDLRIRGLILFNAAWLLLSLKRVFYHYCGSN